MRVSILFIILCAGSCFPVIAQTLSHHVVAPAGDVDHTDHITLAWTLGEVAISNRMQSNESITEGFHQPILEVAFVSDKSAQATTAPDVNVYPNPTNHTLHIHFQQPVASDWQFTLTNADGSQVTAMVQPAGYTDATLDVSALPAGIYFLLLRSDEQQLQYKISRIQ